MPCINCNCGCYVKTFHMSVSEYIHILQPKILPLLNNIENPIKLSATQIAIRLNIEPKQAATRAIAEIMRKYDVRFKNISNVRKYIINNSF